MKVKIILAHDPNQLDPKLTFKVSASDPNQPLVIRLVMASSASVPILSYAELVARTIEVPSKSAVAQRDATSVPSERLDTKTEMVASKPTTQPIASKPSKTAPDRSLGARIRGKIGTIRQRQTGARGNFSPASVISPSTEEPVPVIVQTDSDGPYTVEHYTECSEASPIEVKRTRGVIRRAGEIVCRTFNWTPEYMGKSDAALAALTAVWPLPKIIYPSCEGTNVRLWFDEGQWRFSTFKKCDATRSRWGCRTSHGELFVAALAWTVEKGNFNQVIGDYDLYERWRGLREELIQLIQTGKPGIDPQRWFQFYCSLLRQDRIYTFSVLSTKENRVVAQAADGDADRLAFTGEFDNTPGSPTRFVLLAENTSRLDWPGLGSMSIDSPEDAFTLVQGMRPDLYQGLMIHYGVGTPDFGSIKITSAQYQTLADVRGNEPSVRFRYLQLRATKPELLTSFRLLYPERADEFNDYEAVLQEVAQEIYDGYIARYLKREFIQMPQEQWYVAKDIHEAYLQDPVSCRISPELVDLFLCRLSAVRLNYIIRQHKLRAQAKKDAELEAAYPPGTQEEAAGAETEPKTPIMTDEDYTA